MCGVRARQFLSGLPCHVHTCAVLNCVRATHRRCNPLMCVPKALHYCYQLWKAHEFEPPPPAWWLCRMVLSAGCQVDERLPAATPMPGGRKPAVQPSTLERWLAWLQTDDAWQHPGPRGWSRCNVLAVSRALLEAAAAQGSQRGTGHLAAAEAPAARSWRLQCGPPSRSCTVQSGRAGHERRAALQRRRQLL